MNKLNITKQEYQTLVDERAKKSPIAKNICLSFLVGGLICTLGQWLLNQYQTMGLDKEQAGCAVSMTLICISAILTGLGWYDKIAKFAGAGTLVPITGFANATVSPALEFKDEKLLTGTCAKLFTISGPVIVFGLSASIIYGLVLLFLG